MALLSLASIFPVASARLMPAMAVYFKTACSYVHIHWDLWGAWWMEMNLVAIENQLRHGVKHHIHLMHFCIVTFSCWRAAFGQREQYKICWLWREEQRQQPRRKGATTRKDASTICTVRSSSPLTLEGGRQRGCGRWYMGAAVPCHRTWFWERRPFLPPTTD